MDNYLNTWLAAYPNLRYMLSDEEKDILGTIDPHKYVDYNITRETEIIQIIDRYKPQAWKWVRLYPSLKDLSPGDYAILDHIIPNDFSGEITERDLRRIIQYRKDNARREKDRVEREKAHAYYLEHEEEITQERKAKNSIDRWTRLLSLLGISFTSAGTAMTGTTVSSLPYFIVGIPLATIPWVVAAYITLKIDKVSVAPKPPKIDAKLDWASIVFLLSFYIGFIGLGIMLSTFFVWERLGWDYAETVLQTGAYTIVGSLILIIISAIVTSLGE